MFVCGGGKEKQSLSLSLDTVVPFIVIWKKKKNPPNSTKKDFWVYRGGDVPEPPKLVQ